MPVITSTDLGTNIYPEIISEITRGDDTITTRAINTAVQEAKMYLARYDLLLLFGDDTTAPTVQDEYLKSLVKDLACWHLLRLSSTGIDNTLFRNAYDEALNTLKTIMNGLAQPQGWPYADTTHETTPHGDSIKWSSLPKRNNYF